MNAVQKDSGKRVVVGLTGRVASSVAAFLLKKQGFDVIGMSIITNIDENFAREEFYPKCHVQNLEAIKEFCQRLKIPFYATDAKSQYESEVIDPLLSNKLAGNANASCFNCTEMRIKIMFEKMKKLKADFIATGHFGKIHKSLTTDDFFVHSNIDHESDQSYLLSNIENQYLRHLILPLGELKQEEVIKIAKKFNLIVPNKSKKYNFCFREINSYGKYISQKIPKSLINAGQVINIDNSNTHGDHEGMINHYITERDFNFKGVNTSEEKDIEIVGFDFKRNVLQIGSKKNLTFLGTQLTHMKVNGNLERSKPIACFVKTKYSTKMNKAILYFKNNSSAYVEFEQKYYPLIKGDIFVLYDKEGRNAKVIGFGTVDQRGRYEPLDRVHEFRPSQGDEKFVPKEFKF